VAIAVSISNPVNAAMQIVIERPVDGLDRLSLMERITRARACARDTRDKAASVQSVQDAAPRCYVTSGGFAEVTLYGELL
jgi:hypothetical protein